jgi:hypothetical protein
MGSTRSETPSLWRAMIEDSPEEFLTVPSEEGGFGLPSPRRSGTGAPHAPVTTTPWIENAPATQATTMVPSRTVAPRPDTGLPFEQCHTHQGVASASPCSAAHRRVGGSAMAKQDRRQASHYCGLAARATAARARAQGGEDPDGGLCLHSSSGQGSGSSS